MKVFLFFLVFNSLIIIFGARHISTNQSEQIPIIQGQPLFQQVHRDLQQDSDTFESALEIPGLKYAGLIIYCLGFRIVGMENLLTWQVVQLYQQEHTKTQKKYFQMGDFIHGYTNPQVFAIQGFGYGLMLQKFNFFWETSVILFVIAVIFKHIIAPLYRKRCLNIKNEQNQNTQQTKAKPVDLQARSHEETEMNLEKSKTTLNKISNTKIMGWNSSQDSKNTQKILQYYKIYIKLILYSNFILKQVVFYILINSLPIVSFCIIKQTQSYEASSLQNLSFSGCIIFISSLILYCFTFKLVLEKEKGSRQTRRKFKDFTNANKIFWVMAFGERVSYSVLIGSGWRYGLAVVCGLKFIVLVLSKLANLWARSADYYRNLVTYFIHHLILIVLVFDQYHFSSNDKIDLSKTSIAWVLFVLLTVSLLLSFVFFLKDLAVFTWLSKRLKVQPSEIKSKSQLTRESKINSHKNTENRQGSCSSKLMVQQHLKTKNSINSITTINQNSITPGIKSQKTLSKFSSNSPSSNQAPSSSYSAINRSTPSFQQSKSFSKLEEKTQHLIVKPYDDALMAQKRTHNVIFEEQQENSSSKRSDDADVVSINLDPRQKR